MKYIICILLGLSGGLVVGGGLVAFFTLLGVISNILKFTKTEIYPKVGELSVLIGALVASVLYLFEIKLHINRYFLVFLGLLAGIFIGIVASALAETLDVMPVVADRLNIIRWVYIGVFAIMFGKVFFSIIYWLTLGFSH